MTAGIPGNVSTWLFDRSIVTITTPPRDPNDDDDDDAENEDEDDDAESDDDFEPAVIREPDEQDAPSVEVSGTGNALDRFLSGGGYYLSINESLRNRALNFGTTEP
jgi:hypothetical protein